MIAHVLGRSAGGQLEHLVARRKRIVNDRTGPVVPDQAPEFRLVSGKIAVLNQLTVGSCRGFDHTDIVDEDFTGCE